MLGAPKSPASLEKGGLQAEGNLFSAKKVTARIHSVAVAGNVQLGWGLERTLSLHVATGSFHVQTFVPGTTLALSTKGRKRLPKSIQNRAANVPLRLTYCREEARESSEQPKRFGCVGVGGRGRAVTFPGESSWETVH